MKKLIFLSASLLLLGFMTLAALSYQPDDSPETPPRTTGQSTPDDTTGSDEVSTDGDYRDYSEEELANANENERIVLFFHANWCPTCRELSRDIEANKDNIPSGTLILKADFDSQTRLRQKYKVTVQHTLVQIDKDGNEIATWHRTRTLDDLISRIN